MGPLQFAFQTFCSPIICFFFDKFSKYLLFEKAKKLGQRGERLFFYLVKRRAFIYFSSAMEDIMICPTLKISYFMQVKITNKLLLFIGSRFAMWSNFKSRLFRLNNTHMKLFYSDQLWYDSFSSDLILIISGLYILIEKYNINFC